MTNLPKQLSAATAAGLLVGLGLFMSGIFRQHRTEPPRRPLTHEGYLWQRHWSDAVRDSLRQAEATMDGTCVLIGEIDGQGGKAKFARASVDWTALAGVHRPVAISLRVGGSVEIGSDFVGRSWAAALSEADAAGVKLTEAQWDYDCPTRLLPAYAQALQRLRKLHPELRWTFTALPVWLASPQFDRLAAASDGFVLQAHWLRPDLDGKPILLELKAVREAVQRASRAQVSFRVAMPTYGSAVIVDAKHRWLEVVSEGRVNIPTGGSVIESLASPVDALALIADWQNERPPWLTGIVWYRLPVTGDERNWSWPQLESVMHGRTPSPHWDVALARAPEGFDHIAITNSGDGDAPMPRQILLLDHSVIGFDRALNYTAKEVERGVLFASQSPPRLAAGQRAFIGWVRRADNSQQAKFEVIP